MVKVGPTGQEHKAVVRTLVDDLSKKVDNRIDEITKKGQIFLVELGNQLKIAIENFKIDYETALDQRFNQIDRLAHEKIGELNEMIEEFDRGHETSISQRCEKIKHWMNGLPSAPLVTAVTPLFVVINDEDDEDKSISVEFTGNFPPRKQGLPPPTLIVNEPDVKVTLTKESEKSLKFSVPILGFCCENDTISPNIGELQISRIGKNQETLRNTYSVTILTLPFDPGTLEITYQMKREERIVRSRTSVPLIQDSSQKAEFKSITHPYHFKPGPGWKIVPGTTKFVTNGSKGNFNLVCIKDDEESVIWELFTKSVSKGPSGEVNFSITFDEYQIVKKDEQERRLVELEWGCDVYESEIPEDAHFIFTSFDGNQRSWKQDTDEPFSNSYIEATKRGKNMVFKAKLPTPPVDNPPPSRQDNPAPSNNPTEPNLGDCCCLLFMLGIAVKHVSTAFFTRR